MTVKLKSRLAVPSAKRILVLAFTCRGTAMRRCIVNVFIDSGDAHFGSGKTAIDAGKTKLVPITLTKASFKVLLRKKHVRVDVSYSYPTGLSDVRYDDTALTLKAPATPKPKPRTAAAKHK